MYVDQKNKLRPLRTQRTQSETEHIHVKPSPELWIQSVLKDDCENKNVLKNYGIDRVSLKTAGINQQDRIYNSLFIYSQGVYSTLEELTSQSFDKKSMMSKLWKVFKLLTDKCKPQLIEEEQMQSSQKLTVQVINDQFQSLLQIKEQDLSELQQQIKMRDDTIYMLEHRLNLQQSELSQFNELIQERDKLFSQETKKRICFETKINQIQSIFQQQIYQNEKMKQKLINYDNLNKKLESDLEDKQKLVEQYQSEIREQEQRIDVLKNRVFDSELQAKISKEMNTQLEQKCQDYELKKQKDFAQIQQLNYQFQINQSQQNKLEVLNKQLLNNYENLQTKQQAVTSDLQIKNEKNFQQLKKIQELTTTLELLQQEKQFIQNRLTGIEQQFEKNDSELKINEQAQDELKQKYSRISAQHLKMEVDLQVTKKNYEECLFTYQELKREFDFEQDIKYKIEFDNKRYQDTIKQLEHEKKQLIDQIKDLQKKQMFQLQQQDEKYRFQSNQIVKKDEAIEELKSNQKLLNQSNISLESQLTQLNQNLTDLQSKYSTETLKRQELEQSLKLQRQELKNHQQEYKKMEENLMMYSIKYNQIKDYPDMYREINDHNQILQKLIDQLQDDICLLKKTKSNYHQQTQTEELITYDFSQQIELKMIDQQIQFSPEQNNRSTQTRKKHVNSIEIQTDITLVQISKKSEEESQNDDIMQNFLILTEQGSQKEKASTKQNQYTQCSYHEFQVTEWQESLKQSIEIQKYNTNQKSIQHSSNFDDSYQTRLQPQYEDQNSEKQKFIRNINNQSYDKSDSGEYCSQEQVKFQLKPKTNQKKIELPLISCDKQQNGNNSVKTPSTKFAKMYIQASEYYRK